MAYSQGVRLKKKYGQYFLRDQAIVDAMIARVSLNDQSSILEIGCGDGFLTRAIAQQIFARLWVFEIDPEWASLVRKSIPDHRIHIIERDILTLDWNELQPYGPWTILANLPYHITWPILRSFIAHRTMLVEGVVMVQEEVAQKIVGTSGRNYGFISLYMQHYFEWELLTKVPPTSFHPEPKVVSRLIYFKPRAVLESIPDEEAFWQFIKLAFAYPRRTLRNNLMQTHISIAMIDANHLSLRAQQLSKQDFLQMWRQLQQARVQ